MMDLSVSDCLLIAAYPRCPGPDVPARRFKKGEESGSREDGLAGRAHPDARDVQEDLVSVADLPGHLVRLGRVQRVRGDPVVGDERREPAPEHDGRLLRDERRARVLGRGADGAAEAEHVHDLHEALSLRERGLGAREERHAPLLAGDQDDGISDRGGHGPGGRQTRDKTRLTTHGGSNRTGPWFDGRLERRTNGGLQDGGPHRPLVERAPERPDVCVVGASAAGLAAALAAARAGADVILLESRETIGVPEPPALLAFDFLWTFSELPPQDTIRRRLAGLRIRSPLRGENALQVAAPLSILDRSRFDARLAALAEAAGAEVRTGVKGLRALPDRTIETAEGERVLARVTIYADGPGTLARAFLAPTRDPGHLAWGAALAFDHPGAREEDFVTLTLGSHAPGGRSQLNPMGGDSWLHWTFSRGRPQDAEAVGRRALALDARLGGLDPALAEKAELVNVAPDPVYMLPRELVADGVMVAGGAAGQGGLEVGLASGELAGHVAAASALRGDVSRTALAEYERRWKREHLAGYRALRRASDRAGRLDDARIDRLIAPWAGWRVPMRDVLGLSHPSPVRRAEAVAKFAARNPWALTPSVLAGWRALLPVAGRN